MEAFGIFVILAVIAIVIRLIAGSFDGERVESYISAMGGELLDRSWDPLGPGWYGEKDSRIYAIVYRDKLGRVHRAHVKTSMLSGVYLTNDEIMAEPDSRIPQESIEEEKERLQRRLAELEARSTPRGAKVRQPDTPRRETLD
jgi:hypothetical protein